MFKLCRKSSNIRLRDEELSSTLNTNNIRNNNYNRNNNSYDTNTINYEIENTFLRKELESLQKEIVTKQEYIKHLEFSYKTELEYINKELTTNYNRIVNDLYEENKALNSEIIKLNNEKLKLNNKNYNLEKEIKKQYSQMNYADNFMCNICLDNFKNILLEPCNHLCCCDNCYCNSSITECPLCRKDILATRKVFL